MVYCLNASGCTKNGIISYSYWYYIKLFEHFIAQTFNLPSLQPLYSNFAQCSQIFLVKTSFNQLSKHSESFPPALSISQFVPLGWSFFICTSYLPCNNITTPCLRTKLFPQLVRSTSWFVIVPNSFNMLFCFNMRLILVVSTKSFAAFLLAGAVFSR